MTWHYAIIEDKKAECFKLCEVFYDEGKKKPWGYAETDIVGETPAEIMETLEMMVSDISMLPVMKTEDFKKTKKKEKERELLR